MPYRWEKPDKAPDPSGAFSMPLVLNLWPHRSLTPQGFASFIAASAALLALPLLALLGTSALWVIFAFMAASMAAIWAALARNNRDRTVSERLILGRDEIVLTHRDGQGSEQAWSCNPYWVRVTLHPTGGPVPAYLTLKGQDREVELGAFLTPEERTALADELRATLAGLGAAV